MTTVDERLAPLIDEIRKSRQRAGALSFGAGQAFIFVFFGRTLHATAPGGLTGPDAARYIGRMVAEGAGYEWTSAANGPTFSLSGTTQDLVDLLLEGAHSAPDPAAAAAAVPGPEPAVAPAPPAPAAALVAPTETPSAEAATRVAAPARPTVEATPKPIEDVSPIVFEELTPAQVAGSASQVATPRPVEPVSEDLPAVTHQPTLAVVPPITSDSANGTDDDDDEGEDPDGLLEAAEMAELNEHPEPELEAPNPPLRRPTITVPPLLAGPTILEETPASATRLDTFLGDAPKAQLVYRDDVGGVTGVALFQGTRLVDALWCAPGEVLMGRPAYELITAARRGTVSINELPDDVFVALPACWQGALTLPETPVADVDLAQLNLGLENERATAALQFTTRTDEGLALFFAGRMVAAYTASAPHRQMNRDALAVIATDPTAMVRLRSLSVDALPQPASSPTAPEDRPPHAATSEQAWDAFLVAAQLAAQARLQSHSHRVEAILASVVPGRDGATDAVRQVRSLVQRGISPKTMARLADQIEELAGSRL